MTISEISYRTDELTDVDKLLEQEDYRSGVFILCFKIPPEYNKNTQYSWQVLNVIPNILRNDSVFYLGISNRHEFGAV